METLKILQVDRRTLGQHGGPSFGPRTTSLATDQRYGPTVKGWALAALVVLIVTIAIVVASPSWVLHGCDDRGSDCGTIPPFLVGFVGIVASLGLLFVGALRAIR
jgi:hypothetical protein